MIERRHLRQQLMLKVEFDDMAGFRSNYLTDLSEGGLRVNAELQVGQRFTLHISFLGFVEPIQIEAVVKWSLSATEPDGPAAGLAFVNPSPEAHGWLTDILDTSTEIYVRDRSRVLLLEVEPFLLDVYGQEVRNWAELRDGMPVDLVALRDPAAWLEEVFRAPATLGIIDVDDLPIPSLELYERIRADVAELPLIVIGSRANVAPFATMPDELVFCLCKPLRFGVLMNTVRILTHDSVK